MSSQGMRGAGIVLIEQHMLTDSRVAGSIAGGCPCSAMFPGHPLSYRFGVLVVSWSCRASQGQQENQELVLIERNLAQLKTK